MIGEIGIHERGLLVNDRRQWCHNDLLYGKKKLVDRNGYCQTPSQNSSLLPLFAGRVELYLGFSNNNRSLDSLMLLRVRALDSQALKELEYETRSKIEEEKKSLQRGLDILD